MSPRRLAGAGVLALALMLVRASHAEPTITVRGDARCPSPEMVRTALNNLSSNAEWLSQTVIVDVAGERLTLTLGEDQGVRREIPVAATCQARAETAALLILAWSGELQSHLTSSPVLTVAPQVTEPAPARVWEHALALDVSAFYSSLWGHAPGVWLALGRTPRGGGLGFRVLAAYQSARDLALAGGRNHLRRLLAGVAPTFEMQRESLFASADLGLLLGTTRAEGSGYTMTESARTWNLGGVGDLRGGVQFGPLRLWLNARLLRLFHQETVTIASDNGQSTATCRLNPWDVQLGIGMGVRFE